MRARLLAVAAAIFAVLQFGPFLLGPLASWAFARTHSYLTLALAGWGFMLVVSIGAAWVISRAYRLAGPRLAIALVVGTAALLGVYATYTALFVLADHPRPMLVFMYSTLGVVLLNSLLALAVTAAAWLSISVVARIGTRTHLTSAST